MEPNFSMATRLNRELCYGNSMHLQHKILLTALWIRDMRMSLFDMP